MSPPDEILDEPVALEDQRDADSQPEKRNSGRTGPTSSAGRARSSQNAIKHGACAWTLVLPCESEEAWQLLLSRWCKTYKPEDDSLEYDFVLKTAQAEWHRIRNQRNYDFFISARDGMSPFNWTAEQLKMHDLLLRYKTAAERTFQREYSTLEQHYKIHRPIVAKKPEPPPRHIPTLRIAGLAPTSPTGYRVVHECFGPPKPAQPKPVPPLPPHLPGEPSVILSSLAS